MKRITFKRNKGVGYQPYTETFEFEDNVTEKEITEAYIDWIVEQSGDEFTWYEEKG
jgi:hypothetical protein